MSKSPDLRRLPIDSRTREPMPPRSQPGYYPGHSTLAQASFWDEATRKLVLARVNDVPPIRFFTADEIPIARAVFDRLIPQDDRDEAHRIPVLHYVDARLHEGRTAGYRFEDMPHDRDAYRLGLRAIDQIAVHSRNKHFVELDPIDQDSVLETILEAKPPAAHDIFARMNVRHFWKLLINDAVEAYYAHPFAWDEVGFGGPSYPRGYMRLSGGLPEPWEVDEKRYDWIAPPASRSDVLRPLERYTQSGESGSGQKGSH